MVSLDFPVEGQERSGIVRDSMIRPGCEVELGHTQSMFSVVSQLLMIRVIPLSCVYCIYLYREFPSGVVCQYLLASDGDIEGTKGLGPSLWPVFVALNITSFNHIG